MLDFLIKTLPPGWIYFAFVGLHYGLMIMLLLNYAIEWQFCFLCAIISQGWHIAMVYARRVITHHNIIAFQIFISYDSRNCSQIRHILIILHFVLKYKYSYQRYTVNILYKHDKTNQFNFYLLLLLLFLFLNFSFSFKLNSNS